MKKTPAKQAVSQLDKALGYKIECLDASTDKLSSEILELEKSLEDVVKRVSDIQEYTVNIITLTSSIVDMKRRRDSYQNIIDVKGSKAVIEDANLPETDGSPDSKVKDQPDISELILKVNKIFEELDSIKVKMNKDNFTEN